MFDMIKNIIQKEINTDMSLDPDNYNQFISTFEKIFNENNADEIEEMNKFLLDHNIEYFFEKFKKPDPQMQNDFERMLKEREIETQQPQDLHNHNLHNHNLHNHNLHNHRKISL